MSQQERQQERDDRANSIEKLGSIRHHYDLMSAQNYEQTAEDLKLEQEAEHAAAVAFWQRQHDLGRTSELVEVPNN
jgi:hypothetical protein